MAARSTDKGMGAAPPVASDGAVDATSKEDPVVVTDKNGRWVIMCMRDHSSLLFYGSDDAGATWSSPAVVSNAYPGISRLEADGMGNWVAAWIEGGSAIIETHSSDGGATWSAAADIGAQLGTHSIALAAGGAGTWLLG
jgi:hypothetical protein